MMSKKLIVFDYSGTLSLDSVRFGEEVSLTGELYQSGLAGLGIADPEIFWQEIINPDWEEGSTTAIGYREILYRRVKKFVSHSVSHEKIRCCVSRFVDSYLGHSRVDSRWHPLLRKLGGAPSVITVIATDHYAEATGYIVGFLKKMGFGAISLKDVSDATVSTAFVVANSADIGLHKADVGFWESLGTVLKPDDIQSILMIDDFGANEETGDRYADYQKVDKRKRNTLNFLKSVFKAPVYAIPFALDVKDEKNCSYLISQVSLKIIQYLSDG